MSAEPNAKPVDSHAQQNGVRELEPLDPQITSIQPGGGVCMKLELAWGRVRRRYLKLLRPGYVARMDALRQGTISHCPHEVLDPRDLKYYQNQGDMRWADDPFAWRDRLPLVRVGLGELVIMGGVMLALSALLAWVYWPIAWMPLLPVGFLLWFFRDPHRSVPAKPNQVLSPADGRIFSVREIEYDDFLGGPAVVIDIFLSVFNVHINRVPVAGRVIGLSYRQGKFLNALRPEAARENESLEVRLEEGEPPYRAYRIRQITGAIARRIVCWVGPGEHLPRGGRFGMIKLGSRTELTLPKEDGLALHACIGQRVKAGTTVLAEYADSVSE